ncbi:MAG: V4R domain-containing protein [Thermoproteota archaeon]
MEGGTSSQRKSEEKQVLKLNPKEILCAEYHPNAKLVEISVKAKNVPGTLTSIVKTMFEKNIRLFSGFQTISEDEHTFLLGAFVDVSGSRVQAKDLVKELNKLEGVLEANVSDESFDGLMIDTLHFPLLVSGERSFTLKVETFGGILKRLYEKFGTGAAVILYEMGVVAGENKAKSTVKKHRLDKLGSLRLMMAERAAKGWCRVEVAEFSNRSATLIVNDLFECMPFKGKQDNAVSQFFRGYLSGIFGQLYNKSVSVTEVECVAKGDPVCRFSVQVKD